MTDYDDLRKALLTEQFGQPVKEWTSASADKAAQTARVRELEDQEQHRNDSKEAS